MKYLICVIIVLNTMDTKTVFDFNKEADITAWKIIDDVVMGGQSSGTITPTDEGFGLFQGNISTENNGGFSSLRHQTSLRAVSQYSKIKIRLKGDGKNYQFRINANLEDAHSYVALFSTTGEWQEVEIQLSEMYPSYRGNRLRRSNFDSDQIEEIAFLIGNKKNENFEILLDKIELIK